MFLIGKALYLHYFLYELDVSSSVGKTLGGLLVLELAAFQVCSLKQDFFYIGWDLASKRLEQSFGRIRVIDHLGNILVQYWPASLPTWLLFLPMRSLLLGRSLLLHPRHQRCR
jgi:hypothetical protein